jgi:hypothetical protein
MAAKTRNKIRQVLYRPIKKKSRFDFVTKRLTDAEKVLDLTVGGALKKKRRRKKEE